MKGNAKDYVSTANSSSLPTMPTTSRHARSLRRWRTGTICPIRRESVVPIRGGIDVIWRAFPNARFRTFESK